MNEGCSIADVTVALRAWPEPVRSVRPLAGGWNSLTWLVETAGGRYVAKLADGQDAKGFTDGLALAEFIAGRGLACGAPARTRGDELTVPLAGGALALLAFVPGRPPDLTEPAQVRRAGRTMARAHRILRQWPDDEDPHYAWPWLWVPRCLHEIPMPPEVNDLAWRTWQETVDTVREHRLSVSPIHSDPGPDGFLMDGDDPDRDGLIDWSTALRGPLLYDLASFAVTTLAAGPQPARWFTDGYRAELPELAPELSHLNAVVRARWVANAIYFADRIQRGITRGPEGGAANERGLAQAYRGMLRR